MSGNSGKIEWYLARDGQQHGPLSAAELDKFIELGHLKPTDLLWRAGFDDWRSATEVFPPLPPQAPPPPMPAAPAPAEDTTAAQTFQNDPRVDHAAAGQGTPLRQDETTQPVHNVAVGGAPMHTGRLSNPQPDTNQSAGAADPGGHGYAAGHVTATEAEPGATTQRPATMASADGRQTAMVAPNEEAMDEELFEEEDGGRSGWLMVAAALFLFVLLGAGGLFAYNNQGDIAKLYADLLGETKPSGIAVVRAPTRASREPVGSSATSPATTVTPETTPVRLNAPQPADSPPSAAPTKALPELPILKSRLWQYAQKEMGTWTEQRLAELAGLDKSTEEANTYLVQAFVGYRRDNASYAMNASTGNLQEIAAAFVASLRALTQRGPDSCYALISKGETAPEISTLYMEPSIGPTLEAQMLAILKAIAAGKESPKGQRLPPTQAAFEKLSAELGKRGWSSADLKLFSDPGALSKAEPKLVCRLVTEWFDTQLTLADQTSRDQLIAASLRPVIGG